MLTMKKGSKQSDEPAAMDNERGILSTSFILLILSSILRYYGSSVAIGKTKGVMFSLFFVFMSFKSEAFNSLGQFDNFLILHRDTLPMNSYPLDHLPHVKNELGNRLSPHEKPNGLKCYSALKYYWEIQNDHLFLIKVKSDCYVDKDIKGTLELIFGKYYREGKVAADWYSGSVYGLTGPSSYPCPSGEPVYRNEWEFVFSKGQFIVRRFLDNSKARSSIYASKPWLVPNIIYRQID